jgi:hypothetical protein
VFAGRVASRTAWLVRPSIVVFGSGISSQIAGCAPLSATSADSTSVTFMYTIGLPPLSQALGLDLAALELVLLRDLALPLGEDSSVARILQ